jgi:hypothetical protein
VFNFTFWPLYASRKKFPAFVAWQFSLEWTSLNFAYFQNWNSFRNNSMQRRDNNPNRSPWTCGARKGELVLATFFSCHLVWFIYGLTTLSVAEIIWRRIINWKGWKQSWSTLRYYPDICLEGLMKTTKTFIYPPSKPRFELGSPEYGAGELTTRPHRSILSSQLLFVLIPGSFNPTISRPLSAPPPVVRCSFCSSHSFHYY